MKLRRLYPILAVISILFFAVALIGSFQHRNESATKNKEKTVQSKVHSLVTSLKTLTGDQTLNKMLMQEGVNYSQDLKTFFQQQLPESPESSLYVWKNNKLVYWEAGNYNMYLENIPGNEYITLLHNDKAAFIKVTIPPQGDDPGMLYVVPIERLDDFPVLPQTTESSADLPVIPGLYDYLENDLNTFRVQFVHTTYLFGYLFFIVFIFLIANQVIHVYRRDLVIVGLLLLLLMVRGVSYFFPLSSPILNEFFQPHFFSPTINGSMADWMLNVFVGLFFALFFYVQMPQLVQENTKNHRRLFTVLAYLLFCFSCILFCFFVWAMVENQYIHLDINIIEYFSIGSLLLLFLMFILLLTLFIIAIRLFILVQECDWPWLEKMGLFTLAVFASVLFLVWTGLQINVWLFVISLYILMLLFDLFLDSSMRDFTWISVWLLILSLFSTVLFFHFYTAEYSERSKEALADKITIPDQRLIAFFDDFINQRMINGNDPADAVGALNDVLFLYPSVREDYQFTFTSYAPGVPYETKHSIQYHFKDQWPGVYLFPIPDDTSKRSLEIKAIGSRIRYIGGADKFDNNVLFHTGDWTLYQDRRITNDESLFFPPVLDSISPKPVRDSQFVRDNTIYTLVERGDKAALGRQAFDGLLQPMSFFSFNFILSLLILSILLLVHKLIPFLPKELHQYFIENLSIRNKIQFSVLAILIAAFAMVGIVSANFYKRSYKETLEGTVKEYYQKIKRAQFDREEILKVLEGIPGRFILFDQQGRAIQPNGYHQYHHLPYEVVRKIKLSETLDHFDEIWPGAMVLPFSLSESQTVFLAYPELRAVPEGFYRFINLLLNAFVFLLLISSALSFSISNTIISPLTELGRKLKEFSLGKRNEPIPWKQPDELGTLIQAYNEMVEKLEQSAELLAHTEREVAWREMAKQVAHEIKNPLTPMKLSIQHMELRIREAEEEEAKEIVHHVSKVLIEQIDNLSRIASEFSSFAKLPKPEYEEILLNDLVTSVYDLFRTRSNIKFNLYVPIDELLVQADRTHLIRVMNNLMKNAVQSIPSGREGHIVIRLKEEQGHARVLVEDNGKGIEDDLREKVFFPNFTTKSSGTGLGLAICKNIIESFDGSIYFTKNKPEGTVFVFELPLVN